MPTHRLVLAAAILALAICNQPWAAETLPPAESDLGPSLFAPPANPPAEGDPAGARTTFLRGTWLPGEDLILGLRWEGGLRYELGHEQLLALRQQLQPTEKISPFSGKIGIKLQLDAAAYNTEGSLPEQEANYGIRLLRLYTSGTFYLLRPAAYKLELEINEREQTHYFREASVEYREVPFLQRLKVGHFRAPLSLEGYGGGSSATFMSVAAPTEAFQPGIRYGLQAAGGRTDQRLTWAGGLFAHGDDPDIQEASDTIANLIGRVTWLPWLEQTAAGPRFLHLGLGLHYLLSAEHEIRYRARPESYFAERLVDTGEIAASQALNVVGEAAYVQGPWSVQGELFSASVPGAAEGRLQFWGAYVQGTWALTGESRPYDRKLGVFKSITPAQPFSICDRHWGAWELAARLSTLDLSDGLVEGGSQTLLTLGLNLYLNAHAALMFDVGCGRVDDCAETGGISLVQARLKIDF